MQINKFGEHDPRKLPFEFIPIGALALYTLLCGIWIGWVLGTKYGAPL